MFPFLAALPVEYDLSTPATELAGYVATAAGAGVLVFVALRVGSILSRAFIAVASDDADRELYDWEKDESEGPFYAPGADVSPFAEFSEESPFRIPDGMSGSLPWTADDEAHRVAWAADQEEQRKAWERGEFN